MGLPPPRSTPKSQAPRETAAPEPGPTATAATRFHIREAENEDVPELPPEEEGRPTSARGAYLRLFVYGGIAVALGWLVAQYGVLPGFFLVSDLALPTLFAVMLASGTQLLRFHIRDRELRGSAATVTKATQWSIVLFWFAWNLTQVPTLAFGLAFGLIAYALIAARLRLRSAGFGGFGPGFALSVITVGLYVPWTLFRSVAHDVLSSDLLGPLAPFDLISLAYGAFAAFIVMRGAERIGREANVMPRRVGLADSARARQKESEQRTLAAVVISYLVFRFFISDRIPYGPIVEWFLICGGILFFAIVVANRIGVVPTALALPRPDVRRHVQTVSNLPDERLAETQALIEAFVARGANGEGVHALLKSLYDESGVPDETTRVALAPLRDQHERRHVATKASRAAAVRSALESLSARRDRTKTLKAERPVGSERATGPLMAPQRG